MVGAVLPKSRAESAALALEQAGLAGHELITALRSEEEAVIVPRAERQMGQGIARGAAVGSVVGAAALLVLAMTALPSDTPVLGTTAAIVSGAVSGGLIGGYLGMTRHRARFWEQQGWEHVETGPHEVLLVVEVEGRPDEAVQILRTHGGQLVEAAHPDR